MEKKTCRRCGFTTNKIDENFYKLSNKRGYQTWCKTCHVNYYSAYRLMMVEKRKRERINLIMYKFKMWCETGDIKSLKGNK